MINQGGAARSVFDARWNLGAAGFGGAQTTDGNTALRIERYHQPRVRAGRRRGLLVLAEHGRGICAGRRRHPFFRGQWRHRAFRPVPGRRVSSATPRVQPVPHRRRRLWLAGHHHRAHANHRRHRSAARAASMRMLGRDGSRAASHGQNPGSAASASRPMPPCRPPPSTCRPMAEGPRSSRRQRVRAGLRRKERHRFPQQLGFRTEKSWAMPNSILTLRGRLAWAHDFNPDRAIGATFQTLPGASFVVNGTTGRQFRAHHRLDRTQMAQRFFTHRHF